MAAQASGGGELAPEPDSASAGTAAETGGISSSACGEDGAGADSSMAASVVSSEDGDSTGAGSAGAGVEPASPAACGAVVGASALPVMM